MLCADCRACRRSAPAYASAYTASPAFAYHPRRVAGTAAGDEEEKKTEEERRQRIFPFLKNTLDESHAIVTFLKENLPIRHRRGFIPQNRLQLLDAFQHCDIDSYGIRNYSFGIQVILNWFRDGNTGDLGIPVSDWYVTSSDIETTMSNYVESRKRKLDTLRALPRSPSRTWQQGLN